MMGGREEKGGGISDGGRSMAAVGGKVGVEGGGC